MTSKLQSIRVERFKCILDAPFDVGSVNVLVGANNSGKSSIIQALQFSIGILQTMRLNGRFEQKKGSTELGTTLSSEELIYSPSKQAVAIGMGGRLSEKGDATKITLRLESGEECTVSITRGKNRNISVNVTNRALAFELASLEAPFSVFSPGLAGIAKDEENVSDGVLLRTIARGDANLVLRNTLVRLWNTPLWDDFMADLHEIFPDTNIFVEFNPKSDQFISAEVEREGIRVPLELAGTGLLQATQILAYIHQYSPSIVVLDEPDSHLHPNNQRLLCTLLQNVSEDRGTQILLTTHSRHVVDAVSSTANFLWVRNGTVGLATADDEVGILLDIGALDIKERASKPGTKALVLTEDENVRPISVLLASAGFDLSQTSILPYYGCSNPTNLRPLVNNIRITNPSAKILVHRDRDYLSQEQAEIWETQIRKQKVEPFLTRGVDIESEFLDPNHLSELNEPNVLDFVALISEARKDVHVICVKKAVNGTLDILRKTGDAAKTDMGDLATQTPKDLASDPERFYHGKTVLKRLKVLFKEKHGKELVIYKQTESISMEGLRTVAKKAFSNSGND